MCFSVMILKAPLKAILQALKQEKKISQKRLGEDKTILYYTTYEMLPALAEQ